MRNRQSLYRALLIAYTAAVVSLVRAEPPDRFAGSGFTGSGRHADDELTAVCFLSDQLGWVVGNQGLVLHTADGGGTWNPQPTGVACRLRSVWFVDAKHGWAVGGESIPASQRSRSVVLRTVDGGATWQREATPLLPALRQVRFTSPQEGWVVGDASAFAPSGLAFSRDGGRTWSPAGGTAAQGILCAAFAVPQLGVVATAAGDLQIASGRVLREGATARFGMQSIRKLAIAPDGRGWCVGDGGIVQRTSDGGAAWQSAGVEAALPAVAQCDWKSVATAGPNVWIVGSPGSVVLHSPDDGQTWQLLPTGNPLPLNDVVFVNDRRGWAVGALGTILQTDDAGRTWRGLDETPRRAALWCCFADATDVPFELLSQTALDEGYRTVATLLGRREFDVVSGDRSFTADRAVDALSTLGVSHVDEAWSFPMRAAELRLDPAAFLHAWPGLDDADAYRRAEAYLVRQLRTWRPDVVLTHAAAPRGEAPTEQLVHQLLVGAIDVAGDATQHAEQLQTLGLQPWQVKRVFAHSPTQQRGTIVVTTAEIDTRRATMPADLTLACRTLLLDDAMPPPAVAARLVANRAAAPVGNRGLCGGLGLNPAGEARRLVEAPTTEALIRMRGAVEQRRNLQAIAAKSDDGGANIVSQLREVVAALDDQRASALVFQLAESFRRNGRWEAARETYEFLVTHFPGQVHCDVAIERLIQYLSSGEADWRLQRRIIGQAADLTQAHAAVGGASPIIGYAGNEERRRRCVGIAAYLERRDPAVAAEPAIAFAVASARRRLGQVAEAEQFYDSFLRTHANDAWWECAAAETPRTNHVVAHRRYVVSRSLDEPLLDGLLDDATWQSAEPLELRSPHGDDAAWPAVAFMTHDAEHLYLAVRCRRAPGDRVPDAAGVRTRDADLSMFDRVEFCLDMDRDLATYYKLTVDCRGWTGESCWGDRTWNPTWYVAAGGDADEWIVEAAIPWSELAPQPPARGDVWACGVQRLAPTAGLQSWTQPADATIRPEGFGRLEFE